MAGSVRKAAMFADLGGAFHVTESEKLDGDDANRQAIVAYIPQGRLWEISFIEMYHTDAVASSVQLVFIPYAAIDEVFTYLDDETTSMGSQSANERFQALGVRYIQIGSVAASTWTTWNYVNMHFEVAEGVLLVEISNTLASAGPEYFRARFAGVDLGPSRHSKLK